MAQRVGIVGATGYTGQELLDILLNHPQAVVTKLYSTADEAKPIAEILPRFLGRTDLYLKKLDIKELNNECDVAFLALPHTTAMDVAGHLIKAGKSVIDLSADYRIKDAGIYTKAYGHEHKDKDNLAAAVYGLPEIYKQKIKNARLVANPGCYPTAAVLALAPIVAMDSIDFDSIIIDAKSGSSGAGKKPIQELLFSEIDEDFKAYKINSHQHMPEINQELSKLAGHNLNVTFVPHLLPVKRGILESIYLKTNKPGVFDTEKLLALYAKFYKDEPFVRIRQAGDYPRLKDVVGTNFCDIGIKVDGARIIIISAIDNLLKGASGQAVQNMNIMFGYPEEAGLL